MSPEYATKEDVVRIVNEAIETKVPKMIDEAIETQIKPMMEYWAKKITEDITGILTDFMQQVDRRFNRLEKRLDRYHRRLEVVEDVVDEHEIRLDRLSGPT